MIFEQSPRNSESWILFIIIFFLVVLMPSLVLSAGNFLISKRPPHRPILLDFGLTKKLPNTIKLAVAKMFLAAAEVCMRATCNLYCFEIKNPFFGLAGIVNLKA